MAKNIDPKLKLISEYLKLEENENFVIPRYQRGYSWDITNCDTLWQDIERFIGSGGSDPYFFGTIIMDCSDAKDGKLNLIDGQQRTTTFVLLLKALLLRLNAAITNIPDDEDSEELKAGLVDRRKKIMEILYKVDAEKIPAMLKDASKLKGVLVLKNESNNELFPNEVKAVVEAETFEAAEQNVYRIPRKQKDNKYTNQFRNFKYFYGKLNDKNDSQLNLFAKVFLDKCQIIEIRSWDVEQAITMFNSLNSKGMPLSDADIISAELYSNAGDNKKDFDDQWRSINKLAAELNSLNVVSISATLMQFMYIKRAREKTYINNGSVDVTVPGLRRYYKEIEKSLLDEPLELCKELMKVLQTWEKIKGYPIVKLLLKFNDNARLYLSGYLSRYEVKDITREEVHGVCECLLRLFTILELVDAGYSSKNFKTFLFEENIKLVDKNIEISDIQKDFNEHIRKNWNEKREDIKDSIADYDKNILVYLNEYLYAKSNDREFDFDDNVNIEHIMPASGKNNAVIRNDAGLSKEEFDALVNKLGNKTLLEEDINKSLGVDWFKTKKQSSIKNKVGYKDSKYAVAQALTAYPKDTWGKDDINTATKKVVDRIVAFIFQD